MCGLEIQKEDRKTSVESFLVYSFYVHWCFAMGIRYPEIGIKHSCELPCGYREVNPGPLEDQSVLFTTESSFQP